MLRAFTIMELLIVSVLTVITVGAAFTAFELINRQCIQYEQAASKHLDLQQVHSLMSEDIELAKELQIQGNRIRCILPSYQLEYYTMNHQLVRAVQLDGVRADTFDVSMIAYQGMWKGEHKPYGKVDQLQLTLQREEKMLVLNFTKTYSIANQLITE